jgi:hypothetical protein
MDNNEPQQQSEQEKIAQYGAPPSYTESQSEPQPQPQELDTNVEEFLDDTWKQTQVYLCLLVAMLKEKKNTDKSNIISETIQKIENAPIPEDPKKIVCDSDKISPILLKIKKTMKLINNDMSDEKILDRIIGANISLIKKYIKIYTDIAGKIKIGDISDDQKKEGINMFLDISKILDNLLNNVSSLNIQQDQGQSIGSVEAFEGVIEILGLVTGSTQMVAGKKYKRKSRKGKKSKKSKKKGYSKKHCSRKSKKHRKLIK